MKKEIRSRMVEEKYDVFVAEDGTTFDDESECAEYERNVKMQPVSKLNIEKLNEYITSEEILEFDSDEECMEYFNTYDYQDLKSVEEMKSFQGKYGFNIGKKRYHINTEEALDVLEDSYFSDEELKIMSDGILALIHNVNEAIRLNVDEKVKYALYEVNRRYRELNSKIRSLQ